MVPGEFLAQLCLWLHEGGCKQCVSQLTGKLTLELRSMSPYLNMYYTTTSWCPVVDVRGSALQKTQKSHYQSMAFVCVLKMYTDVVDRLLIVVRSISQLAVLSVNNVYRNLCIAHNLIVTAIFISEGSFISSG